MPNNIARRGCGSFNPNSRKASRHERRKDNNNSDNSGSDGENTVQQKCIRTTSDNTMDKDYVVSPAADVEVDGPSSPSKENNTASTSLSSHPNMAAALSAPNDNASDGLNASMHARTMTPASLPNASPDKATDDDPQVDQFLVQSPTFSIDRNDFQAAAVPNSAPETLKTFTTNKALIDAVNNTFLEMYESYNGKARMTGSGDAKRLVIYFQSKEARDACVGAAHQQNAKVQQARIVYDSPLSIARFDTQWAVYCFSTCLRVTPCHYTVDQKSFHREFVAMLTQLPPNTKDIDLAPLTRDLGAKAVNVPLSLNSYKPKRWAYVTFNSQETWTPPWNRLLVFECPSRQEMGRTRGRNPVAALKERFNINQPARPKERSCSGSRSRLRSKGPANSQSS
ncbi:hypothetical protein RclHR1_38070001 [Rhizophagus clarus]|uniref:RRM domain-containing protein n=1 Tax=Rhizophagus clarus TaxID=94130 RepID=A0A2Z6RTH7_9GLOM|nr:hypothetical protein RclHR1_38070001 [Rhizophagus clarus]